MKQKLRLISLAILIFILLNLYIPLYSDMNVILINKKQVISEFPKIKASHQGYINDSNQEIFWFIQLTDLFYNNPQSGINLNNFFNETCQEIDPLFTVNTGGLVYGDGWPYYNPVLEQWVDYRDVLDDNNINSSVYIDLIGNHDVGTNPTDSYYLNYSLIGSEMGITQYSFEKSFSFGKYAFICLDTTKNESYLLNLLDPYDLHQYGYLYPYELDWYEDELEKYNDYDMIFTFGNNPFDSGIYDINPNVEYYTSDTNLTFDELNVEYNISSYICGQSHVNAIQEINDLFEIETADFDIAHNYRIIAIDHGQISTSTGELGIWPQYVVTYPPNNVFSPEDFNNENNKIRILAWDPNGIDIVQWSAFYLNNNTQITEWSNLTLIDRPLWEGVWNTSLNGRDDYEIRVRFTEETPTINPPNNPPDNPFEDILALLSNLQAFQYLPIIFITAGIFIIVISLVRTIRVRARTR